MVDSEHVVVTRRNPGRRYARQPWRGLPRKPRRGRPRGSLCARRGTASRGPRRLSPAQNAYARLTGRLTSSHGTLRIRSGAGLPRGHRTRNGGRLVACRGATRSVASRPVPFSSATARATDEARKQGAATGRSTWIGPRSATTTIRRAALSGLFHPPRIRRNRDRRLRWRVRPPAMSVWPDGL